MKKSYLTLLLLLMNAMHALPLGNPSEAGEFFVGKDRCELTYCDCFNLDFGFYGDYVYNRHMETVEGKSINTTQLFTNAAYLGVDFFERLELFTTLGTSRLSLNTSLGAFNVVDPHPLFEIESGTAFSYSIGAKATLLQYRCAFLGIEGQYFATSPNVKRLYIAAGAASYPDNGLKTRYSEWQIGTGVSYLYNDFFIPYIGIKYARSYWKLDNGKNFIIEDNTNTFLFNLRNGKNWGYVIGLTLSPPDCKLLTLTIEGRFADEKALYFNAKATF